MSFTGVGAEITRLKKGVKDFEKEAVLKMKNAVLVIMTELFSRTPVWTGETVRNYAVGLGTRPSGGSKGAIGSGDPGPTNSMAMGSEPRRPANEAAALTEALAAVSGMRKLQSVFITNFVDGEKWSLIDSGSAPGGPGQRVRNPGGVVKIAEMNAKARLGGDFK